MSFSLNFLNTSFRQEIRELGYLFNANSMYKSSVTKILWFLFFVPFFLILPVTAWVVLIKKRTELLIDNTEFYISSLLSIALHLIIFKTGGYPHYWGNFVLVSILVFIVAFLVATYFSKSYTQKDLQKIVAERNNEFSAFFYKAKNLIEITNNPDKFFCDNFYEFYCFIYLENEHLFLNAEGLNLDLKFIGQARSDLFAPCYIKDKLHIFINYNMSLLTEEEKANFGKQVKTIFQKHSTNYDEIENQLKLLFNEISK